MGESQWQAFAGLVLLFTAVYCICQLARDRKAKSYGWAVVAALLGVGAIFALLSMPIQTHAVKIDLPV